MSSRAERVELVHRLYAESELPRHERKAAICKQTGFSKSYVYDLLSDPLGVQVARRRAKYQGRCRDCGARTNSGGTHVPERCRACAKAHQEANARWTPDVIIQAIKEWAALHGRPPTANDWRTGGPNHPPVSQVVRRVGWAKALKAAGFEPRWQGAGSVPRLTPEVLQETEAAYRAHGSLEATGAALGISGPAVRLRLEKARSQQRPVRRHTVPRLKPEDMAERQIAQLRARREQLDEQIKLVEQDILKWEAVEAAMRSVNGAAAA